MKPNRCIFVTHRICHWIISRNTNTLNNISTQKVYPKFTIFSSMGFALVLVDDRILDEAVSTQATDSREYMTREKKLMHNWQAIEGKCSTVKTAYGNTRHKVDCVTAKRLKMKVEISCTVKAVIPTEKSRATRKSEGAFRVEKQTEE